MESRVHGFRFEVRIQVLGSRFRAHCTENVERFSRNRFVGDVVLKLFKGCKVSQPAPLRPRHYTVNPSKLTDQRRTMIVNHTYLIIVIAKRKIKETANLAGKNTRTNVLRNRYGIYEYSSATRGTTLHVLSLDPHAKQHFGGYCRGLDNYQNYVEVHLRYHRP